MELRDLLKSDGGRALFDEIERVHAQQEKLLLSAVRNQDTVDVIRQQTGRMEGVEFVLAHLDSIRKK
jgi:hypothetical protein